MANIVLQEVTRQFPGANRPAVDPVPFEIQEGATCILLGTSGSAKTTLLRLVNRLIEPSSGNLLVEGNNIRQANPLTLLCLTPKSLFLYFST